MSNIDKSPLTDTPPFVFVNGKKYVLADTEDTDFADEPLPERWRNVQTPPRYLPVTLWFYLHSYGTMPVLPLFGWIFVLVGMLFCINFLPSTLWELQHLHWSPDGEGEVIRVEDTQVLSNDKPVKQIVFKHPNGTVGSSYTVDGNKFKPGAKVPLLRSGTAVKIKNTNLTTAGKGNLPVVLFLIASLCCVTGIVFAERKTFTLLRDGEIGKGSFMDMNPTGTVINGRLMMRLCYRLVTADGEEVETLVKTLTPERATEVPVTPLLYNPLKPQVSLALDDLPAGISFDQSAGTFRICVLRCVLPFLFCTAFAVELVVLCHAIVIDGFMQ